MKSMQKTILLVVKQIYKRVYSKYIENGLLTEEEQHKTLKALKIIKTYIEMIVEIDCMTYYIDKEYLKHIKHQTNILYDLYCVDNNYDDKMNVLLGYILKHVQKLKTDYTSTTISDIIDE